MANEPVPANQPETKTANEPVGDPNGKAPGGVTWQEAFVEATTTRDKVKADLKVTKAELDKYKQAEKALAEQNESANQKAQREALEQQGKYHEALKIIEDKGKAELDKARARMSERMVPLAIKSAASKIDNLAKESIDDLPQLLRDRIALDPETMEVYVKGPDGKPLVDDKLSPVSVDKFINEWVGTKPYLLLDSMPKRHGQSAGAGKKYNMDQAINDPSLAASWKAEDPDGYAQAEKNYWSPGEVKARLRSGMKLK